MASVETLTPHVERVDHTYYPSGDGEPMAETQLHIRAIRELADFMDDLLAGRVDVWMGVDQYWYWEKGRPKSRCAPDIMVVFGVSREPARRSFFSWLESGKIPSFICEFASENTWREDLEDKLLLFQQLGVDEYFLFDPEDLYLEPALLGFRLQAGRYQPIPVESDGSLESRTLGVRLIAAGPYVRPIDPRTNQMLPNRMEREAAKDSEIARLRALLEEAKRSPNGAANP